MEWRSLSPKEEQILGKMLEQGFPGRDEMLKQISNALVKQIDEEGSLEFNSKADPPADVKFRVPVEASCRDIDGVTIHLSLHVVDKRVSELEVFKEDSSPVFQKPTADRLEVVTLV